MKTFDGSILYRQTSLHSFIIVVVVVVVVVAATVV
jgi:hypothetical protein